MSTCNTCRHWLTSLGIMGKCASVSSEHHEKTTSFGVGCPSYAQRELRELGAGIWTACQDLAGCLWEAALKAITVFAMFLAAGTAIFLSPNCARLIHRFLASVF